MTVEQLISILETQPHNAEVVIANEREHPIDESYSVYDVLTVVRTKADVKNDMVESNPQVILRYN